MGRGDGFGSRRFTKSSQIFLFGFCGASTGPSLAPGITALVCLVLAAWNLSLVLQVRRGDVPKSSNFAFSDAARESVGQLYEIVGHPGAVPANWIFAWTYGVRPTARHLVRRPLLPRPHDRRRNQSGRRRILGRGWSIRERSRDGVPFRWSVGESSSWFVTLFRPFRYRLRVEGEPATSPDRGPQVLDVEMNGASAGRLAFAPGISAAEIPVNERFWRRGLNEIVFRYRYTVDAGEAYGDSNPRRIALRLERLELRIEKVHPPVSSR